ncbi:MAG: hypothetical protein CVU64_22180 [Deltaproteobacteria bacterium HGW-Deltaproteobacteria-21]|nr:MAG: hypothetical protein CVU64_22180 [Deltaproteobacteria bacterium HGW-Deltaproteobacteria-21]
MYRIICISPHFPPRADSESFCGAKFTLELLKQGIELTVICRDPTTPHPKPCDDSKLWLPLKEISLNIPTPVHKDRLRSARLGFRYRTGNYARWVRAVVDTAERLHCRNPYDLVYSRSLPMEAHIAGYWTSRRLKLPWIANINDPWDWHLMPEGMRIEKSFLDRSISNYWMKKTLRAASLVTYPSDRLRDYHFRLCGVKHESEIIPHVGYAHEKKKVGNNSGFLMVHAGKLGGLEARSPLALLHGIEQFLKRKPGARSILRVVFVGQEDPFTRVKTDELGMQAIVEHTGRVSYERSLEFISGASVCVLVEGTVPEGIFLASKLVDYLAAGKPVLALSPANGVVADLSQKKGLLRVDTDDQNRVETAIAAYYQAYQSGCIEDMSPTAELTGLFEPDAVTQIFMERLMKIMHKNASGVRLYRKKSPRPALDVQTPVL